MTRLTRHELYYRLIDVAFVCQIGLIAARIYKWTTGQSGVEGILYYPFGVVAFVGFVLPPLLIFQRWMRDDFSEMLWQRTAGTVLKALVIVPIPLMFIVVVSVALGFDPGESYPVPEMADLPPVLAATMLGFIRSMATLWATASFLFVFAFQWHRWRASR